MTRKVEKEWLDDLGAQDPRAVGSRRDLRRLNAWMGNASILSSQLAVRAATSVPQHLVELGSGDGDLLAQIARRLGGKWRGTRATLVDRSDVLSLRASQAFQAMGWEIEIAATDVFKWYLNGGAQHRGITMANLFLHHFAENELKQLLKAAALKCTHFLALEPLRSWFGLIFSRMVGMIGCNDVTRHDAPISVKAGFSGAELSELWPDRQGWEICERRAGLFGHLFVAQQRQS